MMIGKWTYDLEAMRAAIDEEGADRKTINYMEGIMEPLGEAILHFEANGSVALEISGHKNEGVWKLNSRGDHLILNLTGKNNRYVIECLSDSLLCFRPVKAQDEPIFSRILVPYTEPISTGAN